MGFQALHSSVSVGFNVGEIVITVTDEMLRDHGPHPLVAIQDLHWRALWEREVKALGEAIGNEALARYLLR